MEPLSLDDQIAFERRLLLKFVDGKDNTFALLRKQADSVTTTRRRMTESGFWVEYRVDTSEYNVSDRDFHLGDVFGTSNELHNGIGFVLFVRDGQIKAMEGYTFDEKWPKQLDNIDLKYELGDVRVVP